MKFSSDVLRHSWGELLLNPFHAEIFFTKKLFFEGFAKNSKLLLHYSLPYPFGNPGVNNVRFSVELKLSQRFEKFFPSFSGKIFEIRISFVNTIEKTIEQTVNNSE